MCCVVGVGGGKPGLPDLCKNIGLCDGLVMISLLIQAVLDYAVINKVNNAIES